MPNARHLFVAIVLGLVIASAPCRVSADSAPAIPLGIPIDVDTVIDNRTLVLAGGGIVRLDALVTTATSLPDAGGFLRNLIGVEKIVLGPPATYDRYGRILAQIFGAQSRLWLQRALVSAGEALAMPMPRTASVVVDLLDAEAEARTAGRGDWGRGRVRIYDAHRDVIPSGYALVEGMVHDVTQIRRRFYVNFGPNWRTDFTATISPEDRGTVVSDGLDPMDLRGRTLRVRGWVYQRNGPMLDLIHSTQIEVVEP